ncbi:MAG: hypothetical protein ACC645_06855 [Pirellulales bacterium]
MRLGKYLKTAFLNHWNLLAVGAGAVFAFLSGRPDIVLPVVVAGELAYVGLLGTHPKFQRYVEAQEAKEKRLQGAETSEQALERITKALPAASLQRYEELRARAEELRQISGDLRRPVSGSSPQPFEDLQVRSLDRLLWIFLRLLYTEWSLARFLERTSEAAIQADIEKLESRVVQFSDNETNPRRSKARRAIEDNLATSRARLENLNKAQENYELVQLEIDRLENKIRSLSELAVNRQEPEFISDQVDSVTHSMLDTERTMNDLQFATGLIEMNEDAPRLINRATLKTQ